MCSIRVTTESGFFWSNSAQLVLVWGCMRVNRAYLMQGTFLRCSNYLQTAFMSRAPCGEAIAALLYRYFEHWDCIRLA